MKKLYIVLGILVFFCCISIADTYEYKEGGISIWLPDDWEVSSEGSTVSADAPDGDAFVVLDVIKNIEDLDASLQKYGDILDLYIQGFQREGEPKNVSINGLHIIGISGSGKVEGMQWGVDVMLIDTGNAVIISISAAMEGTDDKYDEVWGKIASSLEKYSYH